MHFLALGSGLFVLYALWGDDPVAREDQIVVSPDQIELLEQIFSRTWQRPPSAQELRGLVDAHIREEIYYREALAMGLDRDDTIVRRRLRQKLEFLTEGVSAARDPSEEELERYLDAHPEAFRVPVRLSFDQVFLDRDRRGVTAATDAQRLLERLRRPALEAVVAAEHDWTGLGDRLMLPCRLDDISEPHVARQFGVPFAQGLSALTVGPWQGPVASGFGWHLVRIRARQEATDPPLDAVRPAVERDWRAARRMDLKASFYQSLRERYTVTVDWPDGLAGSVGVAAAGSKAGP